MFLDAELSPVLTQKSRRGWTRNVWETRGPGRRSFGVTHAFRALGKKTLGRWGPRRPVRGSTRVTTLLAPVAGASGYARGRLSSPRRWGPEWLAVKNLGDVALLGVDLVRRQPALPTVETVPETVPGVFGKSGDLAPRPPALVYEVEPWSTAAWELGCGCAAVEG